MCLLYGVENMTWGWRYREGDDMDGECSRLWIENGRYGWVGRYSTFF